MEFSNLKGLSNQAMVGATQGWIDPEKERSLLADIVEVAGYLGRLTDAHKGLIECQVSQDKSQADEKIKEMGQQADALDDKHDRYIRGINATLEGCILLAVDEKTIGNFKDLQNQLFPEGMSAVNRTYLEEAGSVEMTKGRLDSDSRKLLNRVPTMNGNLEEVVDKWFAVGTDLGDLERKRSQAAQAAESAEGVSKSDVVNARNQWIRVVRAMLAGLDLAENVNEQTMTRILEPLKIAVEKTDRRKKAKESAPDPV